MRYVGEYCDLRLVELGDAAKILELRNNPKLGRYISKTSTSLADQEAWINDYKKREKIKIEYYFLTMDKQGAGVGTIRIYNIDIENQTYTIGSWLVEEGCDPRISIESLLAAEMYAYTALGMAENKFDVRKNNKTVLRFHKSMGASIVDEDELNFYLLLGKKEFEKYLASINGILRLGAFVER